MVDLIARERQIETLHSYFQTALNGRLQIVFITGEAGIGKTALVNTFIGQVEQIDHNIFIGNSQCQSIAGSQQEPYLPFTQILEKLTGTRQDETAWEKLRRGMIELAPDWLQVVPGIGDVAAATIRTLQWRQREFGSGDEGIDTSQRMKQYIRTLRFASQTGPLLLWIDDIHWADNATLDLISFISEQAKDCRILLIATYRPTDVLPDANGRSHPVKRLADKLARYQQSREIALSAFTQVELNQLLQTSQHRFPDKFVVRMNQQSGGNPLFIREYINLLHARKLVKYQKGHFTLVQPELDVEIPFTIQSVIKQRFSLIGADLVRVLTYASVQGESFNGRILAKLLQIEETKLLDQLNQLDHVHHLIRESSHFGTIQHWGTNFQFIHALVQETIYNTLNMGQRQYLHSKTAELMEGHYQTDINQVAILIATHYERSHTLPKAITYYLMAGQNALAAYALDDALSIANTVLRLIDLIPERVPLNELMTLEDSGYRVDTIQLHHQLINHFNEGELRTLCFELQVNYDLLDGQNLSDKSRELILYFERRGKLISLVEKCKKHRPHIEWQDGGTQNKPISLESYLARWKIEALLQIARVQNWRAEWEAAIGTCDVGQRLCQRENLEEEEAFFLYHRGTAVVGQGNEKKSLEYTQDALRLLGDNPKNTILMCQFYGRLGWLSRYHPLPEVEQVLEKALKFAKLYGASDVEARARRHQAWLEIYRKDNAKEGRKLAQKAYDIAYNHKDIYEQIQNLSTLGQAYRRLGDGEKAIQSNQNAVNLAEQNNLPNLLHTALTGLATSYAHVKDDWLKALATIQRAVLLTEQFQYPPSYTTVNVWFHLALGLGQWPEAERAQHLSIKYRPIQKSGGHYLARQGHLAYAQAKYDAARQNYEKAILAFQGTYTDSREVRILQPYYSLALIRVGELDLAKSNLHEAQAYWQTREKSRLARSLQGLALVFAHQGERQKAISELQKAIDLAHNSYSESFLPLLPTIELDLAHLLLESSKLNEAEQYAYSAYMRFELIKHHLLGEAAFLFGKILVSQNTSEKAKRFLSLAKSEWIRLDFYDHLSQWESYIEENKLFFEN